MTRISTLRRRSLRWHVRGDKSLSAGLNSKRVYALARWANVARKLTLHFEVFIVSLCNGFLVDSRDAERLIWSDCAAMDALENLGEIKASFRNLDHSS